MYFTFFSVFTLDLRESDAGWCNYMFILCGLGGEEGSSVMLRTLITPSVNWLNWLNWLQVQLACRR